MKYNDTGSRRRASKIVQNIGRIYFIKISELIKCQEIFKRNIINQVSLLNERSINFSTGCSRVINNRVLAAKTR